MTWEQIETSTTWLCIGSWFREEQFAYKVVGVGRALDKKMLNHREINMYVTEKYDVSTRKIVDDYRLFYLEEISEGLQTGRYKHIFNKNGR